jgi:nicotinamidase-related amidase
MKTCLLVIDVQESFRHRPYYTEANVPAYLGAQNALIAGCVAAGLPVVRIFHTDGPDEPDNAFAPSSGLIRPLL